MKRRGSMKKIKVWECKIIVPEDSPQPPGFDLPLRTAAISAVEKEGIEVLSCFSGWGGQLTKSEQEVFEAQLTL